MHCSMMTSFFDKVSGRDSVWSMKQCIKAAHVLGHQSLHYVVEHPTMDDENALNELRSLGFDVIVENDDPLKLTICWPIRR